MSTQKSLSLVLNRKEKDSSDFIFVDIDLFEL